MAWPGSREMSRIETAPDGNEAVEEEQAAAVRYEARALGDGWEEQQWYEQSRCPMARGADGADDDIKTPVRRDDGGVVCLIA